MTGTGRVLRGMLRLLAAGVLVAPAAGAAAQEPGTGHAPPLRLWAALGLTGVHSPALDVTMGGLVQVTGQKGIHQISLRSTSAADFSSFPDGGSDDSVADLGLLYGRAWIGSAAHGSVSAGASAVFVDGCEEEASGGFQDDDSCTTVGVPLAAEAALQTTFVGIGLQVFANINPEASYGGLALFVQLGWMP